MRNLAIAILIVMMIAGTSYALTSSKTLSTSLTVDANFNLDLGGVTSVFLGNAQAGQTTQSSQVALGCTSNTGNSWQVTMSNTPMQRSGGTEVIPNANCKFVFFMDEDATGTSTYEQGGTEGSLPGATADTVYTSGTNEVGTLQHAALLYVDVPGGQASGTYQNVITFTMVEV